MIDGGRFARFRRSCFRAERSTRLDHTSVPTSEFTAVPWRRTFRRTARFEVSAPQSIFALERHMDQVAHAVGLTPEEFRRRNFIHEGETTGGKGNSRACRGMNGLLDRALQLSDYTRSVKGSQRKRAQWRQCLPKRGIGFATFMHGAGFTGSVRFTCNPSCLPKRRWKESANTRGQHKWPGTNTIFSQIAAEALSVDFDMIDVVQPDTTACRTVDQPSLHVRRWWSAS